MAQRITDHDIIRAEAVGVETVARQRGLVLKGRTEMTGPCPRCAGVDRFAINATKQLFNCRGCGAKGRGAISLVMFLENLGFREAVATLIGDQLHHPFASGQSKVIHLAGHPVQHRDAEQRRKRALEIWRQALPPQGTPVEAYLNRRGLSAPSSGVIRFHRRCIFGDTSTPAMIALVRNIITNEPQAVYRTALDLAGHKIEIDGKDRMAIGSIKGGAIKLTDDAEVTKALGFGEGIETTLSLQLRPEWFGSPIWSLLNDGGIADFPVLPSIETLMIAVDCDPEGEKAATAVTRRWHAAGREVLLLESTVPKNDLNDEIAQAANGR